MIVKKWKRFWNFIKLRLGWLSLASPFNLDTQLEQPCIVLMLFHLRLLTN